MIVMMGVAGAGKSYQGKLLVEKFGYEWFSTGEILRSSLSGARRQAMLEGKLLSDEETITLIDKALADIGTQTEFILDGFPRTKEQADWLIEQVKTGRFRMTVVLNMEVSQDVVRERLLKRGRQDDTEEAIATRFMIYEEATAPILQYFRDSGLNVIDIDASQSPPEVQAQIVSVIGAA